MFSTNVESLNKGLQARRLGKGGGGGGGVGEKKKNQGGEED